MEKWRWKRVTEYMQHGSRKGATEAGATRGRERAIGEKEKHKSTKIKYVCKCDQILCAHVFNFFN